MDDDRGQDPSLTEGLDTTPMDDDRGQDPSLTQGLDPTPMHDDRGQDPSLTQGLDPTRCTTTEARTQASHRGWTLPRWTTFNSPEAQDGDMAEHMRQHAVDSEELR